MDKMKHRFNEPKQVGDIAKEWLKIAQETAKPYC
jgi:hypothetical protein